MRIAIGGILHETSTFAQSPTTLAKFESGFGIYRGSSILERFRGSNMCVGGFADRLIELGMEPVPLLWAFAYPSGVIPAADYAALKDEFLRLLAEEQAANGPVDGLLIDQHGAMVVEGIADADGDFLAAIRQDVGPDMPMGCTFDLHGNHTAERLRAVHFACGYDTYPHVDMGERGRECADLLQEVIRNHIRPVTAFRRLPLFWSASRQVTAHPPMSGLLDFVHEIEQRPGIVTASIATGFPWADIPNMGASVWVTANGDADLAEQTADELADWIWNRRADWFRPSPTPTDAIRDGEQVGKYPIMLADQGDNTGGGAPGDSTGILQTFMDLKLQDAVVLYIVDPQVARQAHDVGAGNILETDVGAKSDPRQGAPVHMRATVRGISDGEFRYDGPMYAGLTGNMGCSAWLEQDGVHVIVVTAPEQPLGPAFALTMGLDCRKMKYISVKSAVHFRNSFEAFAGSIYNVDSAAIHTHDFASLGYQHRPRPMYPIDGDVGSWR